MAAAITNLHRTLGNLACDISQLSSADVEITVNIEFKKNTTYRSKKASHRSTPEPDNFGSARKVVPLGRLSNSESPSAEDWDGLKTEELFPKARLTDTKNI
ncbi:hypothetical protein X798_03380 [Onchocerca flexuosa]|uniref:Uncharacterized protein n=1 Tax=Onchocerca flexuosa TaxID=387005 RepID=A0A238BXP1_9BILA|nr:hypothetical protein X798_03380 [Onchocerca flexuosa]